MVAGNYGRLLLYLIVLRLLELSNKLGGKMNWAEASSAVDIIAFVSVGYPNSSLPLLGWLMYM